jgi:forkhead box protein K
MCKLLFSLTAKIVRTQIMIATQSFQFILPAVAESDDSQSLPSSPSMTRAPSPSVDILSLSPATVARSVSHDSEVEIELDDEPRALSKPKLSKKRKRSLKGRPTPKTQPPKPTPPEKMPPKPQITYANLAYRAIKACGGRATLQDICKWISDHFDWYRLNEEGNQWQVC